MVRKRRVSILKKWLNCLFPAEQVSPLSNRVFEWQFEIGRCATSSKIVEKIFFFVKLFHFLINNRIKNHEMIFSEVGLLGLNSIFGSKDHLFSQLSGKVAETMLKPVPGLVSITVAVV